MCLLFLLKEPKAPFGPSNTSKQINLHMQPRTSPLSPRSPALDFQHHVAITWASSWGPSAHPHSLSSFTLHISSVTMSADSALEIYMFHPHPSPPHTETASSTPGLLITPRDPASASLLALPPLSSSCPSWQLEFPLWTLFWSCHPPLLEIL